MHRTLKIVSTVSNKIAVALVLVLGPLAVPGCADVDGGNAATTERSTAEPATEDGKKAVVTRVVDGDTWSSTTARRSG
jgi:endonuclease YncB( thermonuclease family)